jgi:hypothetical protein
MRLRFSIRDLLWLTALAAALVAVLVAWWHDRARYTREAADAKLHAGSTVKAMFVQMSQDKAIEHLLEGTNEALHGTMPMSSESPSGCKISKPRLSQRRSQAQILLYLPDRIQTKKKIALVASRISCGKASFAGGRFLRRE